MARKASKGSTKRRKREREPQRSQQRTEPTRKASAGPSGATKQQAQQSPEPSWRSALPLGLAVLSLILAFTLSYFWNEDFWWYVASGAEILEQGGIPDDDPFLYPEENRGQWITHSWLWTVIVSSVHGGLGLGGDVFLASLVAALIFGLVFTAGRGDRFALLNGLIASAAFLTLNHRLALKAELASWLLVLIFFRVLDRDRPFTWRTGLLLTGLQWLWSNLHGGYPLGIGVLAAYALASWWRRRRGDSSVFGPPLWWVPILALVSLATPGLALARLRVVASLLGLRGAVEGLPDTAILEWQATFAGPWDLYAVMYALFAAMTALSFFITGSSRRLARLLLTLGMAVVGFEAVRFAPGFVLVSGAVTLANFSNRRSNSGPSAPPIRVAYGTLCLVFGLFLVVAAVAVRTARHDFEVGQSTGQPITLSPLSTSPGAVDYIRRQSLPQPVMNDMFLGGYLIHKLYPDYRFYTDNRNLSEALLNEYSQLLNSQGHWQQAEQRHGFRTVILTTIFTQGLLRDLLTADPRWTLVYLDPTAVVFTRAGFEAPSPELRPRSVVAETRAGPFVAGGGLLNKLAYKIVRYDPDDLLLVYLQTLGSLRQLTTLEALADEALERRPRLGEIRWLRATARLYRQDLKGAGQDMKEAIEHGFSTPEARLQYAGVLLRLDRLEEARVQLKALEREAPKHPQLQQLRQQVESATRRQR